MTILNASATVDTVARFVRCAEAADSDGRSACSPARRGSAGFTLIELLIATTLLAVLALLAWRGLDSVLTSRQRIVAASDELRSMTLAFAQLDDDLRKTWSVRLLRLPTPAINFTVSGEQPAASLLLLRESGRTAEPTQVQQVAWRLRNGVLERGFGAWSVPTVDGVMGQPAARNSAPADAPGRAAGGLDAPAADGLVWQPILGRVASMQMQGWIAGQGWVAAESLVGQLTVSQPAAPTVQPGEPQSAPPTAPQAAAAPGTGNPAGSVQVTGLQVRIVRDDGQVLQRILPVKD